MEQRGFVERVAAEDRRKVIVRLTEQGLRLADEVVVTHMETERGILESLSARQRADAARLLKATLIHLGDSAELDTR